MAKVLQKIGGISGAGKMEVVDTAGVCSIKLDGVQVLGAQGSAIVSLTDSTGGTGNDTLVAIGATYNQDEIRNNMADLSDKLEEVLAALRSAGIIAT